MLLSIDLGVNRGINRLDGRIDFFRGLRIRLGLSGDTGAQHDHTKQQGDANFHVGRNSYYFFKPKGDSARRDAVGQAA
jgi:hypothetical protein